MARDCPDAVTNTGKLTDIDIILAHNSCTTVTDVCA